MGDLILWWTDTGSNIDSEKGLQSVEDTEVIIESGSEIELPGCGSELYSCSS